MPEATSLAQELSRTASALRTRPDGRAATAAMNRARD
jgi:hypothetical protein